MSKPRSTPKRRPRWKEVSSTSAPDPRVSDHSAVQRQVLVTLAVDEDGIMWERVGRGPWTSLGRPPDPPEDP